MHQKDYKTVSSPHCDAVSVIEKWQFMMRCKQENPGTLLLNLVICLNTKESL